MSTIISWTNETWNPTTGCSRFSEGCRNCYAERLSLKYKWSSKPWTFANSKLNVRLHPDRLRKPYTWKGPKRVFVNSMSDLFHEQIPDEYIARVFDVMVDLPRHTFQILTKRAERAAAWEGPWPSNIWMGVSVEDAKNAGRIDVLRSCKAQVKFISYEPALGPLGNVNLSGFDWLIVGGESGPGFRKMETRWAQEALALCEKYGLAFFFKQDSGHRNEMRPWLIDKEGGRWQWQQYPDQRTQPRRVNDSTLAGRSALLGRVHAK